MAFDWGYGATTAPQVDAAQQPQMSPDAYLYDALRQSQTTSFLTPQAASESAQNDSGLGIQNVKRGFAYAKAPMPATTYVPTYLDSWKRLAGMSLQVQLYGRPVMVFIKGSLQRYDVSASSNEAQVEARIDGNAAGFIVPCWTKALPSASTSAVMSIPFCAWGIAVPSAGSHIFTMWAYAGTSNIVADPTTYPYSMAVVEL
jgi:hypothetical protein